MDEWQVGDPPDWGDSVGVPDIPYMGYINNEDEDDDEFPRIPQNTNAREARTLKEKALRLMDERRYDEAIALIDRAIELDGRQSNYYNVKGIILEYSGNYNGALRHYNIALDMCYSKVYEDNKARLLDRMASLEVSSSGDLDYALSCVNDALKITNDDDDRKGFLRTKARILEHMGRNVDSWICIYLANGQFNKVEETEMQTETIKNSKETLFTIAGTSYHDINVIAGDTVDLIAEPENIYDCNAIRIDKDGECVGYVANSPYTVIDGTKYAREIRKVMKANQKAKVMFTYVDHYPIAKLM